MAGYNMKLRNDRLQTIVTDLGASANLLIYGGPRPATGAPPTGATLLVTIPLKNPVGTISAAQLTFTKPDDVQATAGGTAAWGRIVSGDSSTMIDLSVTDTTGNGEVKLNTTTISTGLYVSCQSIVCNEGNP